MKGYTIKYLFLWLGTMLGTVCHAQERMTFLDWDDMSRDTVCPVYAEVVPLETDYRTNDYTIRVDYPEWEKLSEKEMALARRYTHLIYDSLKIEHYIAVERGQGNINYSFVPIVKHGREWRKLTSAKISIVPTPRPAKAINATQTIGQRYAEHSVLAKGKWRKIHITQDGMYKLTPTFLSGMGFKDTKKVHLYGYGGHQQPEVMDADTDFDDLEEVPLYTAPDGSLLFWGNGLVRWEGTTRIFNAYATRATYFLTEGEQRTEITTSDAYNGQVKQSVNSALGHALHEVDNFAWFRAGRNLVENDVMSAGQSRSYSFPNINSLGNERLTVVYTANYVATPLTIAANGNVVHRATVPAPDKKNKHEYFSVGEYYNMNVSAHKPQDNTWRITVATQGSGSVSSRVQGRLDYIALNYTSSLQLVKGFVRFGDGCMGTGSGTGNSSTVTKNFSGATRFFGIGSESKGDIRVMRIGRRGKPASLISATHTDAGWECLVEDGTESLVAFDPKYDFPTPTAGGNVENQDLHATGDVDMVIIIPESGKLEAQANRLAEAHEKYDGVKCLVVRADNIYNEFSSGTPDATAYRRFMKMLYDRGQKSGCAPKYLLLMGDAAWDNRMISSTWRTYSAKDHLLCYQSENSNSDTQSYCWEDYFGLLDDGEGGRPFNDISDLGIGRFPVTTEAQARAMVDKTIAHLKRDNSGEWNNRILVLGDDGDDNIHMRDANKVADTMEEEDKDVDVRKIMWDNYTIVNQGLYNSYPEVHALLEKQYQEGAMMFNYTGHGAPYLLSHERVITLEDIKSWKTARHPLWFVAACVVAPFDSQEENLGEAAVRNPYGAVAFIGTPRTVYSTPNFHLNRYFAQYLLRKDTHGKRNSVGEALRMAKGSMVSSSVDFSNPQNKLQFALLGDPALIFGAPDAKVVLDSIDGVKINGKQTLKGGSRVRLSGHIEMEKGVVLNDFHGTMTYRLYDAKNTIVTRENVPSEHSSPFTYTYRDKEINHGTDSVKNGKFQTTVIIPKDISYSDESGRVVFYAVNNDNSVEANGSSEEFMIGGYNDIPINDTIGPEMFIYLNDRDFMDGDMVPGKPIFIAELQDESGIQYNGNGIGHDLQLCIDGDARMTYNLNKFYTGEQGNYNRGKVIFNEMPELKDGAHWLSFRAWDMLNNTSEKTLKFVVGENLKAEVLSLTLEDDVVSGNTKFHIAYNYPGLECSFRLEIFSHTGALLWRREMDATADNGIVSIPWNGHTNGGAKVDNGIYICRVTASHSNGKKSHKEKKFILKSNK